MARILPKKELWQYQPDSRVMRAPPRERGTTAQDVLAWSRLLAGGAELLGPVAGHFFSGGKTVDPQATQAELDAGGAASEKVWAQREKDYAKLKADAAERERIMARGPGRMADVSPGGGRVFVPGDDPNWKPPPAVNVPDLTAYEHQTDALAHKARQDAERAYFERHGRPEDPNRSSALLADATAAAVSGDRKMAADVARRLRQANFGDVTAGSFGDLLTGAHKDKRRAQISKILRSGRYPSIPHESLIRQREQQIAASKARTSISQEKLAMEKDKHPLYVKALKTKAFVDDKTKGYSVRIKAAEAKLKELDTALKSEQLKFLPKHKRAQIQNIYSMIAARLRNLKLNRDKFEWTKTTGSRNRKVPSDISGLLGSYRRNLQQQDRYAGESEIYETPKGEPVVFSKWSREKKTGKKIPVYRTPEGYEKPTHVLDSEGKYQKLPFGKSAAKRASKYRSAQASTSGASGAALAARDQLFHALRRKGFSEEEINNALENAGAGVPGLFAGAGKSKGGTKTTETTKRTKTYFGPNP